MSTKEWQTPVVLSLTSGKLLAGSFSDMHELAEFIYGGPVWTHEFASERLCKELRLAIFAQHPSLEGFDVSDVKDQTTANAAAERGIKEFGRTLLLTPPTAPLRTKGPMETLREVAPDKPVIVVLTEGERS